MIATLEPIVRAGDLFSGLHPEEPQELDRTLQYKRTPCLERIFEGFHRALQVQVQRIGILSGYYNVERFSPSVSSKEIYEFSILLNNYQKCEKFHPIAGLYLSSLVNKSPNADFKICTQGYEKDLTGLGYNSKKNIAIDGNIGMICCVDSGNIDVRGDCANIEAIRGGNILVRGNSVNTGYHMSGGTIEVLGNTYAVGYKIRGGKIIIHGDAYHHVGEQMDGGEIHIGGDANKVGFGMNNGRIYLYGSYNEIGAIGSKGKIFSKQVIKDGKWREVWWY